MAGIIIIIKRLNQPHEIKIKDERTTEPADPPTNRSFVYPVCSMRPAIFF